MQLYEASKSIIPEVFTFVKAMQSDMDKIWTHFLQVETQVSGLCFPVFEQNTEVYEVNLCIQT